MDSISAQSSANSKQAIMNQIREEAAMANARTLIGNINKYCFLKCVPKPGTSLSSSESSCFTQCMDKYMATWNTVSRQYVAQLQAESAKHAGMGGNATGGIF